MSDRDSMNGKDRRRRRRALMKRQDGRCHWCGRLFDDENVPTLDHLLPRIVGGSNALDNLVLACEPCNNRRGNPPLGRRRKKEDGVILAAARLLEKDET